MSVDDTVKEPMYTKVESMTHNEFLEYEIDGINPFTFREFIFAIGHGRIFQCDDDPDKIAVAGIVGHADAEFLTRS